MNFIRIFDNNFWNDEAATANVVMRKSLYEILEWTASDVHPPLYYLFVKAGYSLFGNQGWMFHLISLIPCAIIIVLALTAIWNRLGKETAIILITLATLSYNAVCFNMEVRMYSWGSALLLLSFYSLYLLLSEESNLHYIVFTICSLLAAYTHYYCLIAVAFFYIVLLILGFMKRLNLKKVLVTCLCTIIAYLPWLLFVLRSLLAKVGNFWISDTPTFKSCVGYLFSSQFAPIVWCLIGFAFVLVVLYEVGILQIAGKTKAKQMYRIKVSFTDIHSSTDLIWLMSGIISVFGTIGFGITVSTILTPCLVLRYLYPVSIIAWMILGVVVSKLKLKKLATTVLLGYMLVTFLPVWYQTYQSEKDANTALQTTLKMTVDEISKDDVILSGQEHIAGSISSYYYPGIPTAQVDLTELPELDKDTCYWLIIDDSQDVESVREQLEEQSFSWTQIVDSGNLGTWTVSIYQASYQGENNNADE